MVYFIISQLYCIGLTFPNQNRHFCEMSLQHIKLAENVRKLALDCQNTRKQNIRPAPRNSPNCDDLSPALVAQMLMSCGRKKHSEFFNCFNCRSQLYSVFYFGFFGPFVIFVFFLRWLDTDWRLTDGMTEGLTDWRLAAFV